MSKWLFSWILILALTLSIGCRGQASEVNASLGKTFILKLGQTASITAENLKIKFAQLVGDSRCPLNAQCVWQGEVTCQMEITLNGSKFTKTLVKSASGPEYTATSFTDYEIQFDVQPYPRAGTPIPKGDYYLKMIVNKKSALSGGILVTFDVAGEAYKVFTSNPATIEQIYAVQKGQSQSTIPNGKLVEGADYNQPWSWHVDPRDIQMAEVTIELCDGTPSQVEANLDYWLNTVKRFCPWNAKIINIDDLR